jgi:hypothetical protein
MGLGRDEDGAGDEYDEHQRQQEGGDQKCLVSDAGRVFSARDQPDLIHSNSL